MRVWQLEALKERRNKLFFKLWALSGDCKRKETEIISEYVFI